MPSTILLFGLLLVYVAISGRLTGFLNVTKVLLGSDIFKSGSGKFLQDGGFHKGEDGDNKNVGSLPLPDGDDNDDDLPENAI